jgi:methionine sulfoxide reductase heme-binding subunit
MTRSQALPVVTVKKIWLSRWTGFLFVLLCLVPLFRLLWRGFTGNLTANPIQFLTYSTGDWTLRFLIFTLAITPLPSIVNQPQLFRFRRMTGLLAFFYGFVHLANWIWLDKGLNSSEFWEDILRRQFIVVGMVCLVLTAPLAVTPTAWWVRRLGPRPWQALQWAIYVTAAAGVIYYYWSVKSDIRVPVAYGAILSVLLLYQAALRFTRKRRTRPASNLRAA